MLYIKNMIMYKFSKRSLSILKTVNPILINLLQDALTVSPIDFGIPNTGGIRSTETQHQLWLNGFSKCDGTFKKSKHQIGHAIDIYAYINGATSYDRIHLSIIAGVILSCAKRNGIRIKWGGTFGNSIFKGWDMGHFELLT